MNVINIINNTTGTPPAVLLLYYCSTPSSIPHILIHFEPLFSSVLITTGSRTVPATRPDEGL